MPVGDTTQFQVFDPKPRQVHAPVFQERVLHHGLMRHMGPVLDRSLIDDSFGCRLGKGAVAAVGRVQHHYRGFPWYAKIDIRQYFPRIDHVVMFGLIERQFKDEGLLRLVYRIIHAHEMTPATGLPIGALTSQHCANLHLNGLDCCLLENPMVRGIVRYMDDTVSWCETKDEAKAMVAEARCYLESHLKLRFRTDLQINRSAGGVTVCGYHVQPGAISLTRRRRRRYAAGRDRWERQYCEGTVSARQLQSGYAAVLGSVLHADSVPGAASSCGGDPSWKGVTRRDIFGSPS